MTAEEIEAIRRAIVADPENAAATAQGYQPLFVAHPAARVAIIGQAPGRRAQESGIPWNDASGVTLMAWLGVDEPTFRSPELFAILPMDFYYPGPGAHGDLPPRRGFAARWHPPLLAAMPDIRLTLVIGAYAQQHYLGPGASLTERTRRFRDYLPERIPLVHPSPLNFRWQARNPWFAEELLPELRRLIAAALTS